MSSDATPHPLLYVVPARRAVVREVCTYDEAMMSWLGQCKEHVEILERWYQPLRPADAPRTFFEAWRLARRNLTRRWEATLAGPVNTVACVANPGGTLCDERTPPLVRLWKGPLRVLLEQEKYGVLGRTLRTEGTWAGTLTPPFQAPMMQNTGTGATVGDDGIVTITFGGQEVALRQNYRGEVTLPTALFLPGDLLEFPLFTLLGHAEVEGMSGAEFNALGSPFLGTSVRDAAGNSPGRLRIHDNLIAMRFQLHLNMTRGAYSSLRPVMNGPLAGSTSAGGATNSPTPQNPEDMNDDQLIRYVASVRGTWGERMDVVRLARPRPAYTAAQRLAINTAANRLAQQLRRIEAAQLRAERARARQEEADARLAQEQARAALRTATPEELEGLERLALAAEREAERAKAADRSLGRLRADYGALCNQAELHPGTRVYARGLIYGGSLQSTPPVGYGTGHAYRYGSPNWGTMNAVPSYRAWGSIPATAESQRLTASWVCTSATLATSYYMLHATNGGGGSLRSHVDSRASALFSSDPDGPHAAKFVRFMSYAGDPARDEHAIPELIGSAGTELRAFLETQVRSDDNPAFLNQAIRKRDTRQALDVPISLPQLRDYFLGRYRAGYTVVTMSAHEYMLFWLWPHDKLLSEPPQDGETVPAFELPPASSASDRAAELPAAFGVGSAPPDPSPDASGSVLDVGPPRDVEDSPDEEQFYDVDPLISVRGRAPSTLDRARTNLFAGGLTPLVGHGPPVAGFIAAYNPLDGSPFATTTDGDLFTYEASGVVFRIRYRRVPGSEPGETVCRRSAFTGKPTRFQRVERAWVRMKQEAPPPATVTGAPATPDSPVEPETRWTQITFDELGEREMTLLGLTHMDVDVLRQLYRHPMALERLEVFMAREQLDEPLPLVTRYRHAFTDASLPRPRRGQPPIDHPESRDNVVAAWYADRAVPFPTLLETRDNAALVDVTEASENAGDVDKQLRKLLRPDNQSHLDRSSELEPRLRDRSREGHRHKIDLFLRNLNS